MQSFTLSQYKNEAIFVIGGQNSCYRYSIPSDEWSELPSLNYAYSAKASSCVVGSWLYLLHLNAFERLRISAEPEDNSGFDNLNFQDLYLTSDSDSKSNDSVEWPKDAASEELGSPMEARKP